MKSELRSRWQRRYPTEQEQLRKPIGVDATVWAIPARGRWPYALWLELRPQQWVKNLIILAPLLFSQNLFNPLVLTQSLTVFALFCLISSSVYLFNDIKDCKEDRLHPQKRYRPIASGALGVRVACWTMVTLLLCGLAGGVMVSIVFALVIMGYWLINFFYSIWLKRMVILDVFAIAAGFVLRVVGGGIAIQVEISHWLLICTMLLALFLGFSKRRHELVLLGEEAVGHRQVLTDYSPHFLDMMIGIVTASTVMSYALYTVSEETTSKFHTQGLLLTLPFVLYGIFRYLYLVYHRDEGGDPTQSLLNDWPTLINLCLWAVTVGIVLY